MQENWIGKSRGCSSASRSTEPVAAHDGFEVFTTRPDTIFGASFAAISPDHPIALALAAKRPEARRLHRRVQARAAPPRPSWRRRRSWASTPASKVVHPLDPRLDAAASTSPISC